VKKDSSRDILGLAAYYEKVLAVHTLKKPLSYN
jgi:hypothetical protein